MWPLILMISAVCSGISIIALVVLSQNPWPLLFLVILWVLTYWRWITLEFRNNQ